MARDPDVIRHEIDQLTQRIKTNTDALTDRVSPTNIANNLMEGVMKDPAETYDRLINAAARHPVAGAMLAASAVTLLGAAARNGRAGEYASNLAANARTAGDKAMSKATNAAERD